MLLSIICLRIISSKYNNLRFFFLTLRIIDHFYKWIFINSRLLKPRYCLHLSTSTGTKTILRQMLHGCNWQYKTIFITKPNTKEYIKASHPFFTGDNTSVRLTRLKNTNRNIIKAIHHDGEYIIQSVTVRPTKIIHALVRLRRSDIIHEKLCENRNNARGGCQLSSRFVYLHMR